MKVPIKLTGWHGEKLGITIGNTYEMDTETGHFLDDDLEPRHAPTYGKYTVELEDE